jgi:hypothetical protein
MQTVEPEARATAEAVVGVVVMAAEMVDRGVVMAVGALAATAEAALEEMAGAPRWLLRFC